jgi:hypothetical protein
LEVLKRVRNPPRFVYPLAKFAEELLVKKVARLHFVGEEELEVEGEEKRSEAGEGRKYLKLNLTSFGAVFLLLTGSLAARDRSLDYLEGPCLVCQIAEEAVLPSYSLSPEVICLEIMNPGKAYCARAVADADLLHRAQQNAKLANSTKNRRIGEFGGKSGNKLRACRHKSVFLVTFSGCGT